MNAPPHELKVALSDRYRIERELGRGGMATVYLAHDLVRDRAVAIKVMHLELSHALDAERFAREVRLAGSLDHPNIVGVYDSGSAGGQVWFAMPFIDGESLRQRLKRDGQLPVDEAIDIVGQAAAALGYAHDHGVMHRDVKPDNLLLSEGHVFVADFGIARALDADGEALTKTGIAVGTPAYMAPEQASGERQVDQRVDVYALGAVLYEMLAGVAPFTGPSAQAIIARAMTTDPQPIHPVRSAVSPALDEIIVKAMSRTPADRYGTMRAFAEAVRESANGPTAMPDKRARGRRRVWLVAGTVVAGAALVAAGARWLRTPTPDQPRLGVLAFENVGATEDQYFASGVSDEVRFKLGAIRGLRVLSRAASSVKTPANTTVRQAARQLGVGYFLTGTVRWQHSAGAANRVHLLAELVNAESGDAVWTESFDAALTDVFAVQADIASRVAAALEVTLTESDRRGIQQPPTENLQAYDAYLRGLAAIERGDAASLRQAVAAFDEAVALDSGFAGAWASLSVAHSARYYNAAPTQNDADAALRAAQRAIALAPTRPEGHSALARYYRNVKQDVRRGYSAESTANSLNPTSADRLVQLARIEQNLGRWLDAARHATEAERIDPRSVGGTAGLSHLYLRQYSEAGQAYDRALSRTPTSLPLLERRAMVYLAQGDLLRARELATVPRAGVEPTARIAFFGTYLDLMWVLDDAQQQVLLRLSPSAFDGDRGYWGLVLAQTHLLRGERVRAQAYADSALRVMEEQVRRVPLDAQRHVLVGLLHAIKGDKARAEKLIKEYVDVTGDKKKVHEVITERVLRSPKPSFVYSIKLD